MAILISEGSPYFSYYPCQILGPRDVALRSYKRKCGELLKSVVYTFLSNSQPFCLYLLNAKSLGPKILQGY